MLKKVTLGLIATLGVNASVLAAGPGMDVPIPAAPASIIVTSPVQQGSWEIGLEAGFYQPANENFQYAQNSLGGGYWKNYDVQPDHQWAGHADVTFRTPGPGGFVQLAATHFSASKSDDEVASSTGAGGLQSPFTNISSFRNKFTNGFDGSYDFAKGVIHDDYTDVDLVAGRTIDVSSRTRFNFYGGLRYASIDNDSKGDYAISDFSTTVFDSARIDSQFDGLGLRAGVSTEVNLAYGFSFVGNIAGSLLTGKVQQKVRGASTTHVTSTGAVILASEADIADSDDLRVVPELDARVGLHYDYGFTPFTSLGLEVGYQVTNYFNVTNKDLLDAALPNTVANSNNFGFQGLYLRAQVNLA